MRIAALYDIHGNLPALEAVLEDVSRETVEMLIIGGDIFPGPMSAESLSRLLDLDIPVRFISGNGDREVLALARGEKVQSVPEAYRAAMRWVARRLDPEHAHLMAKWPASLRLKIEGRGDVLFYLHLAWE